MRGIALSIALLSLVLTGCEQKPGPPGPQGQQGVEEQQAPKVMLVRTGLPARRVQRGTPEHNCVSWRRRLPATRRNVGVGSLLRGSA